MRIIYIYSFLPPVYLLTIFFLQILIHNSKNFWKTLGVQEETQS